MKDASGEFVDVLSGTTVSIPARGERCIEPEDQEVTPETTFQSPQGVKDASGAGVAIGAVTGFQSPQGVKDASRSLRKQYQITSSFQSPQGVKDASVYPSPSL